MKSCLCKKIFLRIKFEECTLNAGNRMINNVELIPSTSTDYYEYICLSARKPESRARDASKFSWLFQFLLSPINIYANEREIDEINNSNFIFFII